MDAGAAERIVAATLETDDELSVHPMGRGRVSVARRHRPTWALVACICTVWVVGLGLLFLLVRRTESGDVSVVGGARGVVVTVPPVVDAEMLDRLETQLRTGDLSGPPPAMVAPLATRAADDLDTNTVVRGVPAAVPGEVTDVASPAMDDAVRLELRFPGGVVSVLDGEDVILGRAPSPRPGCRAVIVPGDGATLSKSHLLVRYSDGRVEIEDLGSTNGTRLASGATLTVGDPVVVEPGGSFDLGAVRCLVQLQPSSAVAPK